MTEPLGLLRSAKWIPLFAALLVLLTTLRSELETSRHAAAAAACFVSVTSIGVIIRLNPRRPLLLGTVYAALLSIFHIGLLIPIAFGSSPTLLNSIDVQWVTNPGFEAAAVLASIAIASFSLGYLSCFSLLEARFAAKIKEQNSQRDSPKNDGTGVVGLLLLISGVSLWGAIALSSGVQVVGSSYEDFLAKTQTSAMPISYLLMGFGLGVVAASPHAHTRRPALIIFALWAAPAFMLGLRGEVIIPIGAYVIVAARRRYLPIRPWMGVALLAGLSAGSAVRVIRQSGIGGGTSSFAALNPFRGIAELGYSIRPLVVVSDWHDRLHEPFVGIATYTAPFHRFIAGHLLGEMVLPVGSDPAVFGGVIAERVGPIGGSPAAEAYRTGGTFALVLVMVLIGVLIAILDSLRRSPYTNALLGMMAFSLLLWVRNDFTPVPAQFALTVPILLCVWFLNQRGAVKQRPRQQHPLAR